MLPWRRLAVTIGVDRFAVRRVRPNDGADAELIASSSLLEIEVKSRGSKITIWLINQMVYNASA
jgi:hypothetical protein